MTSVERKTFRNYFEDLQKQSEKAEKTEVLSRINETFEVLGSLTSAKPKHLIIKGVIIHINEMGPKELKFFTEFAQKFLQKVELSEEQAEKMLQNLSLAEQGIKTIHTKDLYDNFLKREALIGLEKAKGQILIHEKIEPIEASNNLAIEAKNHIKELLKIEQKKALDAEQKLKEASKRGNIVVAAVAGAVALGIFAAFAPIWLGVLIPVAAPLMIGLIIGGVLISGIGYTILKSGLKENILKEPLKDFKVQVEQLKILEKYKKLVEDEKFTKFAHDIDNDYSRLKNDPSQFLNFMRLYEMQSDYEKKRQLLDEQLTQAGHKLSLEEKTHLLKTMASDVEALNLSLEKINQLRRELSLKTLENTEL